VPAIQYAPNAHGLKAAAISQETDAIRDWADRLAALAQNLQKTYADATVNVFSAYDVFRKILAGPTAYRQTQNLKALSGYCPAYANGTARGDAFVASCTVPANQYFWLNTLHPTYPVHDALGFTMSTALSGVPRSAFLCSA
jgi:phospholipase/lecithinase/hemolysin